MRRALLAALVLVLGGALTACSKSSADTFAGAVLPRPYHAPSTDLTDTDGRPFSLADSTDKRLTLVYFGYTHCPDECPTTMATVASAMLQLDDADRLDALGAVGLARCLMLGGALGRPLYAADDPFCERRTPDDAASCVDHFYTKLLRLEGTMQTASGREEARQRTEFLRQFLAELKREIS